MNRVRYRISTVNGTTPKTAFLFLMLFYLTIFCQGQENNPRCERKFGFGGQILGPTLLFSANLNYFITHNFNMELGGGLVGYYGGIKYYFGKSNKPHKWTPYFGAHYTSLALPFSNGMTSGIYAPAGIQLMTSKGFTFAPEIAFLYLDNTGQKIPLWGAIKVGYNF